MTDQPDLPPELLERVKSIVFADLWNRECYNGVTLRNVDRFRINGPESMSGRVEEYEAQAERIASAVAPMLIAHGRELEKEAVAALPGGAPDLETQELMTRLSDLQSWCALMMRKDSGGIAASQLVQDTRAFIVERLYPRAIEATLAREGE